MYDHIQTLIGKKSRLDDKRKKELQVALVKRLIIKNLEQNAKKIDILLTKFEFQANEYPSELIELKKSNTVNFFVNSYI